MDREDFIEMRVGGLTLDPVTKTPVVILKDAENKLTLPIWIGLMEATAMATELEGIKMARPMTHDLLRNLIADLGGVVEFVEVTDLRDNTYYAAISLQAGAGCRQRPASSFQCHNQNAYLLPCHVVMRHVATCHVTRAPRLGSGKNGGRTGCGSIGP